jgi:hypothetical protein
MFHLTRTYVDATRNLVGPTELIADYAVDFRVGFTVDAALNTTGVLPLLLPLPVGDTSNAQWGYDLQGAGAYVTGYGPHRIRSVRVQISTRAALADQQTAIQGTADGGSPYSFCTASSGTFAACNQFARMRTITTEIAAANQSRAFY